MLISPFAWFVATGVVDVTRRGCKSSTISVIFCHSVCLAPHLCLPVRHCDPITATSRLHRLLHSGRRWRWWHHRRGWVLLHYVAHCVLIIEVSSNTLNTNGEGGAKTGQHFTCFRSERLAANVVKQHQLVALRNQPARVASGEHTLSLCNASVQTGRA